MSTGLLSYIGFGYFFGGNDNKEYKEGYDKSLYKKYRYGIDGVELGIDPYDSSPMDIGYIFLTNSGYIEPEDFERMKEIAEDPTIVSRVNAAYIAMFGNDDYIKSRNYKPSVYQVTYYA